jgi:hypothetical protein
MVKKAVKDALGHYVQNAEVLLSLLQEDAELLKSPARKDSKTIKGKRSKVRGLRVVVIAVVPSYTYLNPH